MRMKLFKIKDPKLWQSEKTSINNDIMGNFDLAKEHMLPKVVADNLRKQGKSRSYRKSTIT
jgi:hypothetical protein